MVIGLTSSDTTEGTVAPASLTFTPQLGIAQTVTITGVNDNLDDGDLGFSIVTAAATSTDTTATTASNAANVSVTNTDNDAAGITVATSTGLTVTEAAGAGTATFTVVLNSQPTADVIIGLTSSDTSEGHGLPAIADLHHRELGHPPDRDRHRGQRRPRRRRRGLLHRDRRRRPAPTPGYSGMNAADVSVTNTDNDTAGITVTADHRADTTEAAGDTATFTWC